MQDLDGTPAGTTSPGGSRSLAETGRTPLAPPPSSTSATGTVRRDGRFAHARVPFFEYTPDSGGGGWKAAKAGPTADLFYLRLVSSPDADTETYQSSTRTIISA